MFVCSKFSNNTQGKIDVYKFTDFANVVQSALADVDLYGANDAYDGDEVKLTFYPQKDEVIVKFPCFTIYWKGGFTNPEECRDWMEEEVR